LLCISKHKRGRIWGLTSGQMKFVIPGTNVKLLGKAIHSLAKIGDDVYIEPSKDSLSLRAVNSSRSAYATFNFGSSFFSSISPSSSCPPDGEEARCKVMVRSLLLAFRSLSVLEKTIESCSLETGILEDSLLISLHCRHRVDKQLKVGLVECEAVRAVYSTEGATNSWTVQARVLQEANGNFLATQEEVTMHVTAATVRMNNFAEECADEKKLVHTELSMQSGEFETYSVTTDTSLTFCLKELKSLIGFAEYLGLTISASFTVGGQPLILTASCGPQLSCVYVLATLADPNSPTSLLPRISETPAVKKAPRPNPPNPVSEASCPPPPPPRFHGTCTPPPPGRVNSTQALPGAPGMDSLSLSAIPELAESAPMEVEEMMTSELPENVPRDNNNSELQEHISTPPAKRKKRQLFKRCFEKTFNPNNVPGSEKILAPDSDED